MTGARGREFFGELQAATRPVVVGAVVETSPGATRSVGRYLERIEGVTIVGDDGRQRLAVVWEASEGQVLLESARALVRTREDVLGVFPTFVGDSEP